MKPVILSDTVRLISFFIFLCCAGAFLLQIPFAYKSGEAVPFIDALFTAVSAVCVTGLSTVDMEVYSRVGFIIIMILIELGGLGIISFISIFIGGSSKKVSLVNRRVVRRFSIDNIENNPRNIVKNILFYAFIIQGVGFLCLMPTLKMHGVEDFVFDALFLSVSAFCNAGFAVWAC
ncbi:MAG: potassium transporter TrkG [Spirochaetales bacterium]